MKQVKVALLALLLVIGFNNANAQDKNNPWAISFGVNAVDFYPTNPQTTWGGNWYNEFANADDHYNILPAISSISVTKYLVDGFSFEVAGAINKIEKMGDMEVDDLSYFSLDGAVKYDVNTIIGDTKWFDPYVLVGGGYTWLDDWATGTVNGGIGANFWFSENIGLNVNTKYKHSFESKIYQHWQHSAGLIIKFGGTDTDKDGIYDKFDACPEVFGLAEFDGCPDTDSDGIIDSKDACPEVAGLAALNGCPDADGDGVTDAKDECPNVAGLAALKGCPDADADGITDAKDACPKVAGPSANKGCPWPDTDGDSVLDKDDNCIDLAGPASNNGCPQIAETEVAQLESLFKKVYFKVDAVEFTEETPSKLEAAAKIMSGFPTAKFSIEGHTDSYGRNEYNQKLSEDRADAVEAFLISKGVSASNLTSTGFGKTQPIASNRTKAGRAQNRRVEIKLVD